jgi:hypothetical protein
MLKQYTEFISFLHHFEQSCIGSSNQANKIYEYYLAGQIQVIVSVMGCITSSSFWQHILLHAGHPTLRLQCEDFCHSLCFC